MLLPPAELSGKDFDKFKAACANFIGFRRIDDQILVRIEHPAVQVRDRRR